MNQEGVFLNRRTLLKSFVLFAVAANTGGTQVPLAYATESNLPQTRAAITPKLEPQSLDARPGAKPLLGVNMFGAIYSPTFEQELDELSIMGVSLVRVMVANKDVPAKTAAARLATYSRAAQTRGIRLIACCINQYGGDANLGYYPKEVDFKHYTQKEGEIPQLHRSFFEQARDNGYLDFLQAVIPENRGNIYAWEPANEARSRPEAVAKFLGLATREIKRLDSNAQVSSGLLSTANTGLTPGTLYERIPDLAISIHDYNNTKRNTRNSEVQADADWAIAHRRELIMGELGYSTLNKNRVDDFSEGFEYWGKIASSIFIWGFSSPNEPIDQTHAINRNLPDDDRIVAFLQTQGRHKT